MQLENFTPQTLHVDFQLYLVFTPSVLGFLFDFVEIVNPRFGFCRSCFGLTSHPIQFFFKQVFGLFLNHLLQGHSLFFLLKVIGITPFIAVELPAVQFDDFCTHPFQKVPVMCDHKQGHFFFFKESFQPFNHFQVQVIGWLVQNQQIGFVDQNSGQSQAFFLPSGKLPHFLTEVIKFQFGQNLLVLRFKIPRIVLVHQFKSTLVGIGVLWIFKCCFVLFDDSKGWVVRGKNNLFNGQFRVQMVVLCQITDVDVFSANYLTSIGTVSSRNDVQNGCFSGPIFGDKGHFLIFADSKREVFKQNALSIRLGDIFYR